MPDLGSLSMPGVVVLAMTAAAAWGTSDFGGGVLGRRGTVAGALLATQAVGFVVATGLALARGELLPAGQDLWLALLAGALASIGVAALYGGLAIGRMAVVAPVAAVLTAIVPATIGLVLEGLPGPVVLIGMALAMTAVGLVSGVADHPGEDRPSGLWLGLVAGVALGVLGFVLSRIGHASLFAPLAVVRAVQLSTIVVVVVIGRRSWRLSRAVWPLALATGAIDLLGNALYLVAARIELAPTAVVSSLYPVVTVILAATVLGERMTRAHLAGIGLAALGVALISGGSAGG